MNVFAKLLVVGMLLTGASLAEAQNVNGTLRVVKGDVQVKSAKTGQTAKARIGEQVFPQDMVITGADSRAKIVMVDNNEINVSPDSKVEIQHYEFDPAKEKKEVLLNVLYGKVRAKVEQKYDGKTSKFQVKTPSAVAGVRGTDFVTSYNQQDSSSNVTTFRGAVEFGQQGPNGTINNPVMVTPGKSATSVAGGPPSKPTNLPKGELAKRDQESNADENSGNGNKDRKPSGNKGGDNRSPSSTGPSSSGGGSALLAQDPVGGSGGQVVIQVSGGTPPITTPPIIPQPGGNPLPPVCYVCNQILQGTSSDLTVHLTH